MASVKPHAASNSKKHSSRLARPVTNKSTHRSLTTRISSSQPSGETFVAKPEIRHAGIVNVEFGKDVTVIQPVNLYGCAIGDGSFVGPFVEIQRGVNIGQRCRIQSHAFICELVTIGDECFISHGAMFVNDLFGTGGPAENPELWRPTQLGNRVSVGTNATILPVRICDQVVIGAGAVVTKNITVPGIYAGNPVRLLRRL
jgi:acetyltransferase-like isoleucine patch superfamily enzyme